jgi:hypothetical protein
MARPVGSKNLTPKEKEERQRAAALKRQALEAPDDPRLDVLFKRGHVTHLTVKKGEAQAFADLMEQLLDGRYRLTWVVSTHARLFNQGLKWMHLIVHSTRKLEPTYHPLSEKQIVERRMEGLSSLFTNLHNFRPVFVILQGVDEIPFPRLEKELKRFTAKGMAILVVSHVSSAHTVPGDLTVSDLPGGLELSKPLWTEELPAKDPRDLRVGKSQEKQLVLSAAE